jgi:hypothetical protein
VPSVVEHGLCVSRSCDWSSRIDKNVHEIRHWEGYDDYGWIDSRYWDDDWWIGCNDRGERQISIEGWE